MSSQRYFAGRSLASVSMRRSIAALAFGMAAALSLPAAGAAAAERSGKDVVQAVCSACHATGANGAPKIGDKKAWGKLASQGLTSLTGIALSGIRKMPPHGGSPGLSDGEIERAITYMVNQSGGNWAEPISKTSPAADRSGEQIVKEQCAKCHQTGVSGAPRIGDHAAWVPRFKQGIDVLVRSAIKGHGPMPPRGGLADLTDPEIRAAINYMFNPAGAAAPAAAPKAAAPAAASDPFHKTVGDTEIYLGVATAESMRASGADSSMHGGIPSGKNDYHVNVSLFDRITKAPIADAQVDARVADPVMGEEKKKLELMTINKATSYGNFFHMQSAEAYTITLQIRRPGTPKTIEVKFNYKH